MMGAFVKKIIIMFLEVFMKKKNILIVFLFLIMLAFPLKADETGDTEEWTKVSWRFSER